MKIWIFTFYIFHSKVLFPIIDFKFEEVLRFYQLHQYTANRYKVKFKYVRRFINSFNILNNTKTLRFTHKNSLRYCYFYYFIIFLLTEHLAFFLILQTTKNVFLLLKIKIFFKIQFTMYNYQMQYPFTVLRCKLQKLCIETFIFVFVLLSLENTKHERCLINRKSFSIQNTQRNVNAHLIWSVLYLLRETQYHLSQSRIMKFTISCF